MKKQKLTFLQLCMVVFNVNTGYKQADPGMSQVFIAPTAAITSQPEPTTTYGVAGDTAQDDGSWTFASENGFSPNGFIDLCNDLLKGAQLQFMNDGDLASPSKKTTLKGRVIGLDPELIERFRDFSGVPITAAVKTPTCGADDYYVVGCKCSPAYLKFNFDSDELGGSNGKRWEFEITANCAPYLWTGTLPLKTVD